MTYIKKEDVQTILDSYDKIYETKDYKESIEIDINSLPSINPEAMIEEMIEKEEWKNKCIKKDDYSIGFIHGLKASKELIQKFKY